MSKKKSRTVQLLSYKVSHKKIWDPLFQGEWSRLGQPWGDIKLNTTLDLMRPSFGLVNFNCIEKFT